MSKAKICHMTTVHSPFDDRIFHKECKTLAKAGYEVFLIAQHDKEEIIDGVHIIPLPKVKSRLKRMLLLPIKALSTALKVKADVYHFHDPELIPIGVLLKLFTRKKVIYDVHEDYGKQILSKPYIPKSVRKVISSLIKVLEYISSRFFDGIITATDDILRNFVYHKRVISVRNFPIIAYFPNPARFDRESKDAFNLIYVGGLTEIRGIVQIVQALELVDSNKQLKLILYGKFDPPEFELEVRSLKEFERVEYLGWVDFERVPELLSKADVGMVCLHPISNYITGLPVKLFEYMSAGLPAIASNFPLWKEIVEGNNCGICVDPLNPKEIAKAVKYLMEYPDEARKMGENGRKVVLEKYNWENESKKLIGLYKKLLAKEEKRK
jgi:glycosyltransferase involved in cell wall biosynthesis